MTQKRNITIDDIARDLGVSKTTISRAISGKGRISEATRAKVMDYIQQCNYRPSAAAKGLAETAPTIWRWCFPSPLSSWICPMCVKP